ncbi:unnamed protein product [Protopolystoma xenopodis]|uniref:Uncharacterized protein n=1 Tax=Protopolystoma xenopodis TaxID=117903 RepID=A0A3S5A7K3_9PLAT|nr:unnamed protein product [Protopolystoma xenopodis]
MNIHDTYLAVWRHRERCLAIAKRRSASSAAAASQRSQAAGGQTAGRSKLRKRGSTLSGQPGANSSGNAATPATAVSGGYSGESGPPNGTYLSRLTASTSHSRSCPSRVSHGGLRSSGRGTRPTRNCPAPVGQAGRSWVKQKVPGRIASDLSGEKKLDPRSLF